jgi:hypothetical protein
MAGKTVTRADLAEAVYQKGSLSRAEAAGLVEQVIRELCDTLAVGETVKLSSFGVFTVRERPSGWGAILRPEWPCRSSPANPSRSVPRLFSKRT